jgi:uncharacterized membrane protein YkoI
MQVSARAWATEALSGASKGKATMEQKLILLSLTAAVSLSLATGAFGYTGENLASGAKLTMTKASDIAVKARPGKITDRELEQEKGGSGLRYSFDVQAKGVTWEVGVDAVTGKVLENDREGKNPD